MNELLRYYRRMKFHLHAVNPRAKTLVKLPVRYCLQNGGNVALYEGKNPKWLVLDLDTDKVNRVLKPLFSKTPIVKSAKGYGILVRYDSVSERIAPIIKAYKNRFFGSAKNFDEWMKISDKETDWLNTFMARCKRLGFKDDTFIKGLMPDFDGYTYYLLPPSVTCRYEGANGVIVKRHSGRFPFCNSSPTKKHEFVERTWLNRTEDSITFSEFLNTIGVRELN